MDSASVEYERSILQNVMCEVRSKFCSESISVASVETLGSGEYAFSLPAIPELPEGFYWCGYADTVYGGQAFGWEAALKELYQQSFSSANTSVNSTRPPAIARLVDKHVEWQSGTTNVDLGCGRYPEHLGRFLLEKGITNIAIDKFNQPAEMNQAAESAINYGDIDTVTISNVLCVIKEAPVRAELLQKAKRMLSPGGKLFVTVYEGNGSGVGNETKPDCWQENRRTADYVAEIEDVFGRGTTRRYGKLLVTQGGVINEM